MPLPDPDEMQTIFGPDNTVWHVPGKFTWKGAPPQRCRSCNAIILWVETANLRSMPLDRDGRSHFVTCPDAGRWRKRR